MHTRKDVFDLAEREGFSLFEMHVDCKDPSGRHNSIGVPAGYKLDSWKGRHSKNRATWETWRPDANIGLYAAGSGLIVVDIDSKVSADAHARYLDLCSAWDIHAQPHVRTPSGGAHVWFRVPAGTDMTGWRQPPLVMTEGPKPKAIIETRVHGLTLMPTSVYGGIAYTFWSPGLAPICAAPAALLDHCRLKVPPQRVEGATYSGGRYRPEDVAKFISVAEAHGVWEGRDEWRNLGMALKAEFGPELGLALWQLSHNASVTAQVETDQWASFATEYAPGYVRLESLFKLQNQFDFKCHVRDNPESMWAGIAQPMPDMRAIHRDLYTLDPRPAPGHGSPLMGGANMIAEKGRPIVQAWMLAHSSSTPAANAPTIPEQCLIPIRDELNVAIPHLLAIQPKHFKTKDHADLLAVLKSTHEVTGNLVVMTLRNLGCDVSDRVLEPARLRFQAAVDREHKASAGWQTDSKGIRPGDSRNVSVFLDIVDVKVRHNGWTNKDEITWPGKDWRPLADHDIDSLMTTASSTEFGFCPTEPMFRRTLRSLARESTIDPVLEQIAACEGKWDRTPRLDAWLVHAVGATGDPYVRAVSANVIGGMVKRARRPGVKHDEVMILISDEGKAKTELCRRLAFNNPEWFNNSVRCDGGDQNVIPQLFGRMVIELAELDMSKREVAYWKGFISRQTDDICLKYDRLTSAYPRRNIFIATTNEATPLLSDTGNRRFLPVHVIGEVNIEWLDANLVQLIGEAAVRERAGETFSIPRAVWEEAGERQEEARAITTIETFIREWFEDAAECFYIKSGDLELALIDVKAGRIQGAAAKALRKIGFLPFNLHIQKKMTRGFVKSQTPQIHTPEWRQLINKAPVGRPPDFLPVPLQAPPLPPLPPADGSNVMPFPLAR